MLGAAFKALQPWLLDGEFELRTDSAPLAWIHQKKALSSLHVRWLDVLAEFKYTVAHIPGKLNVADPLTRQYRVGAGVSGAAGTSDRAAAGAAFACAVLSGLPTSAPRLLRTDFGADLQRALRDNPFLGDLAVKAKASPDHTVNRAGAVFI